MKQYCNNVEFYQQWVQIQSQKAHNVRLKETKGSNYLDYDKMKMIDKIVNFRIRARQRDKMLQNQQINHQNSLHQERIMRISSVDNRQVSQRVFLSSAKRELSLHQQEKDLQKKNQLLKQRLSKICSDLDQKIFLDDYQKHQMIKNRMSRQKYYINIDSLINENDQMKKFKTSPVRPDKNNNSMEGLSSNSARIQSEIKQHITENAQHDYYIHSLDKKNHQRNRILKIHKTDQSSNELH